MFMADTFYIVSWNAHGITKWNTLSTSRDATQNLSNKIFFIFQIDNAAARS